MASFWQALSSSFGGSESYAKDGPTDIESMGGQDFMPEQSAVRYVPDDAFGEDLEDPKIKHRLPPDLVGTMSRTLGGLFHTEGALMGALGGSVGTAGPLLGQDESDYVDRWDRWKPGRPAIVPGDPEGRGYKTTFDEPSVFGERGFHSAPSRGRWDRGTRYEVNPGSFSQRDEWKTGPDTAWGRNYPMDLSGIEAPIGAPDPTIMPQFLSQSLFSDYSPSESPYAADRAAKVDQMIREMEEAAALEERLRALGR